jgi:predicted metallopeptidase
LALLSASARLWRPALVLRWDSVRRPLPVRVIQPNTARAGPTLGLGQPWHDTGAPGQPFDFTANIRRLLEDIVARTHEFARIKLPRVLISATQARGGRRHGLQARVTPLRFQHGQIVRQRHGVAYQVQRYFLDDHEFLYVLTFCLPRFLDQEFDDKLITLFHELHHIDPDFSGDLRRHAGRCPFHTASQRHYDKHMAELARAYLATKPDVRLHAFLRLNFAQLRARHAAVTAIVVPRPKQIPIPSAQSAAAQSH